MRDRPTQRAPKTVRSRHPAPRPVRIRPQAPSVAPPGVKVLCVDDHALLIEGLRAQFAIGGRITVVDALASADRLIEEVARLAPDIVLLDIEMPGPDVFEMVDRLRRLHPQVRTVFLSAHVRDGYLAAAYQCGAWGYFSKADAPEDIAAGVQEVARSAAGTFVVGRVVRKRLVSTLSTPTRTQAALGRSKPAELSPPLRSLTDRELEVLRLIGRGLSRNEIAAELCRSVKTIDGHQERMMKKLGISARPELLRFAIREGLAEA